MADKVQLEDVIRAVVKGEIAAVHTNAPGIVVAFDDNTLRADVQLINNYPIKQNGRRVFERPPILAGVPVHFPGPITWPIAEGAPGWIEFGERAFKEYLATGNERIEPLDGRKHSLSDPFFSPAFIRGENDYDPNAVVVKADEIKLGGSAVTTDLARADRVEARLQAIENYINTHEHNYLVPLIPGAASPTTGKVPQPAIAPTTAPGDTASDKVKGE